MFVVDTNVLLYAANTAVPEHPRCRELLLQWRRDSLLWYLTWGILYTFLRVATHPRVFERPWSIESGWKFAGGILRSPGLTLLQETERHEAVAEEVLRGRPPVSGNLLFDAHTAILMREHGISKIYTRDTAFHCFSFLAVIDPMA